MTDGIYFRTNEEIADAIALMSRCGEGYRAPLFRAARDQLLAFAMVSDGHAIPRHFLDRPYPTAIVLADDTPLATGPKKWQQAVRLLRWAKVAIFHAAAGEEEHYRIASLSAQLSQRLLLVEMRYEHHPEWLALVKRLRPTMPVLNIVPRQGVHPLPETVH